jgi:hypothetical protein
VSLPPLPTEWRACQICRRVLEAFRDADTGELWWDHTGMDRADGVNHVAVPVPYSLIGGEDAVRERCDFCGDYDPTWTLPVADFNMADRHGPGKDWGSTEDWRACDRCANLLTRNDWNNLLLRAAQASAKRDSVPLAMKLAELRPLYAQVRKHQKGAVRSLHPLGWKPTPVTTAQALVELDAPIQLRPSDGTQRLLALFTPPERGTA